MNIRALFATLPAAMKSLMLLGLLAMGLCGVWYAGIGPRVTGPFTLDEALSTLHTLPVYRLKPASIYGQQLKAVYYHVDRGDELIVEMYFTEINGDALAPVARLTTYTLLKAGPPALGGKVVVGWAAEGSGYKCQVTRNYTLNRGLLKDTTYRSCLYWMDTNGRGYILYTIWPEDQTVEFANSLIMAN